MAGELALTDGDEVEVTVGAGVEVAVAVGRGLAAGLAFDTYAGSCAAEPGRTAASATTMPDMIPATTAVTPTVALIQATRRCFPRPIMANPQLS